MNRAGQKKHNVIMVSIREANAPKEIIDISLWWKEKADAYGDEGTCVLGAGMEFEYEGAKYFMPPMTVWQGASSWEHCIPELKARLADAGATDVYYHPGRMD